MQARLNKLRRTFVGDKALYKAVLTILIPIVIQNGISNFVNLLDNLMVGALGDNEISGVAIANQLIFVFNLCTFGGLAGAGIFGAQFFGAGDMEGLRNTFRIKWMILTVIVLIAFAAFLGFSEVFISLFLKGDGDPEAAKSMLHFGKQYLMVSLAGLPAFAISQAYAGTLRETGETRLPMAASVAAVIANCVFNYLLIFGKLGFPRLGVAGAAAATVLSRYVELGIIVIVTHTQHMRYSFIKGVYRTFRVPGKLLKDVLKMGSPLLFNEMFWSIGQSTLTAIYSLCGLAVVSAMSVTSTIANLFNVVFMSMGTAVAVMVGQALGADEYERAKELVWKLMAFAVAMSLVMASLLIVLSPVIPQAYSGLSETVRDLASKLLRFSALAMPLHTIANCSYFTLRSGGKTGITFLFDCGYTWVFTVPLAFIMVKVVGAPILVAFGTLQLSDIFKDLLGIYFIRKGIWIQNIAKNHA